MLPHKLLSWVPEDKLIPRNLSRNPNAITYLTARPHLIDWDVLSCNPNAIDLLTANPRRINWRNLSCNKNALDLLIKNQHLIDWYSLSSNDNRRAIEMLEANRDRIYWSQLATNPSAIYLLEERMEKFPYDDWWDMLVYNRLGLSLIHKHISAFHSYVLRCHPDTHLSINPTDESYLSLPAGYMSNPKVIDQIEQIVNQTEYHIHWDDLSSNPAAIHILQKNIDKIAWRYLSDNPAIFEIDYQLMATQRSRIIEDELLARALAPERVAKWHQAGVNFEFI